MPQIKFTDTAIAKLTADKTTWFSDPTAKGLQLCVTASGTKTWYLNKWSPVDQKTRRVKLGQFARTGAHTAWAKKKAGAVAVDIDEGRTRTRTERAREQATRGLPTFGGALDRYVEHRTSQRASGKSVMLESTAIEYRRMFERHLSEWADCPVDELPVFDINQHLNELQVTTPHAAHKTAVVAGAVVRFTNKLCALAMPVPGLLDGTKMKSRVETGKLDMTVPLADRWADIDTMPLEHMRIACKLLLITGSRWKGALQSLTWDQVDLDASTITFSRLKKQATSRVIVISDDAVHLFERLREIARDECDWVFPCPDRINGVRNHLGKLQGMSTTKAGDFRHYWMSIAREVAPRHVHRWLAQQTLTDDDLRMLGHYGEPSRDEQKRAAEAIAAAIRAQIQVGPNTVVEIGEVRA